MTLARISITLPQEVVVAADRRAAELDRPRSWIVVEALRAYLGRPAGGVWKVAEPSPPPYEVRQVADARRRHLESDLSLPPAERLRRAEELGRLARHAKGTSRRHQIIGFDSYEDFHEWKKGRLAGA
jgi:hypothetical protein